MILYNVTINIDETVHDEWLTWMKEVHIPEVMGTGLFTGFRFFRLISRLEGESGETYSIQYFLETLQNYHRYKSEFAPAMQAKLLHLFGTKQTAFRTLLEEV